MKKMIGRLAGIGLALALLAGGAALSVQTGGGTTMEVYADSSTPTPTPTPTPTIGPDCATIGCGGG